MPGSDPDVSRPRLMRNASFLEAGCLQGAALKPFYTTLKLLHVLVSLLVST